MLRPLPISSNYARLRSSKMRDCVERLLVFLNHESRERRQTGCRFDKQRGDLAPPPPSRSIGCGWRDNTDLDRIGIPPVSSTCCLLTQPIEPPCREAR